MLILKGLSALVTEHSAQVLRLDRIWLKVGGIHFFTVYKTINSVIEGQAGHFHPFLLLYLELKKKKIAVVNVCVQGP